MQLCTHSEKDKRRKKNKDEIKREKQTKLKFTRLQKYCFTGDRRSGIKASLHGNQSDVATLDRVFLSVCT